MPSRELGRRVLRWVQYLLGVLMILGFLGGWVLVIGIAFDLRDLYAARERPAKQAVLTHSYAREARGYQNRTYWRTEIAGRYADGSGTFGVTRHAYGIQNSVNTRARAEALAKRYPVGTTLDVYPEPGRPRDAILEPGTSATPSWIAFGLGTGLILLPFALYLRGRLRGRRPDRDGG